MPDAAIPCFRCGTCCIAPDISTLHKPLATPCIHLCDDHLCGIYTARPPICRAYQPDEICLQLQALPPEARVQAFLATYGLLDELQAAVVPQP